MLSGASGTPALMISVNSSNRVLVFSLMLNGIILRSLSPDSDLLEVRTTFYACQIGNFVIERGFCEELHKWYLM
jgi:hypothetical protein